MIYYDNASEWFTNYMKENEPPYYLSLDLVKELAKKYNYECENDGTIIAVWGRMLDEFCPIELWAKKWIDLPKRINEIDDTIDYIYGWGNNMHINYRGTYIYRISSEPIAMLLRLSW